MAKTKRYKLMELADIQGGYQSAVKIHEDPIHGTHRLIQGANIENREHLNTKNLIRFIPQRGPDPYYVSAGDLLFLARGADYYAYWIREELENTLAASIFYIIRIKNEGVLPGYLEWWLNQAPTHRYLRNRTEGTNAALKLLRRKDIDHLPVKLPPLSVQQNIQQVARLWQKERDLNRRLMEKRECLIQQSCLDAVDAAVNEEDDGGKLFR